MKKLCALGIVLSSMYSQLGGNSMETIDFANLFDRDNYILTAGTKYIDIDVLSCAVALEEILDHLHIKSSIYLPGPFNGTIPQRYQGLRTVFINTCPEGRYILLDISDPKHVDPKIDINNIDIVFDHHFGHEIFWKNRIHEKAIIKPIGACATLIAELAIKFDVPLSQDAIQLLLLAIVSNTLNFKSKVTTDFDRNVFNHFLPLSGFSSDWIEQYYQEVESGFINNLKMNIENDTKQIGNFSFAQIELYSFDNFLKHISLDELKELMPSGNWVLSLVHIEKNENILIFSSEELSVIFQEKVPFIYKDNGVFKTTRLFLRKEFLKYLQK